MIVGGQVDPLFKRVSEEDGDMVKLILELLEVQDLDVTAELDLDAKLQMANDLKARGSALLKEKRVAVGAT